MPPIYLDNAASTAPAPEVLQAFARAATDLVANPSAAHGLGAAAARALEQARVEVARLFRGHARDLTFTSGGTEANALAINGAAALARGRHAVASAIEHPAVLRNIERLRARGFAIDLVAPGPDGVVSPAAFAAALRPDTAIAAIMLVNNELGTIQPVAALARAARAIAPQLRIHVDAVQAAGMVAIDVDALGADSIAISGHKFHGLKGIGALWIRSGARIAPVWEGGGQERGLRSGTENLPGIVALGCAARRVLETNCGPRVAALRDLFEAEVFALQGTEGRPTVPPQTPRAPHIASIVIPGLPAEPLLHALEARGVIASAGSACAAKTKGRHSHVLAAIGLRESDAVLRFSLSTLTTEDEVKAAAIALREAITEVADALALLGKRSAGKRS